MLWISGDTVLYEGVRKVADRVQVGTALLHLGGVQFPVTGPIRYTMTARDAIELCRLVEPRTAIPIHYEGWKHFQQGREDIERELADAPRITRKHPVAAPRRRGGDRRVSAVETLAAEKLFQIAFIVRDLDAALERYSAMLSAGPWRCWTLHSENHIDEEYMGGPTDYVTRLALTSGSEEIQLELVQPVKGPSIQRLAQRARRGLPPLSGTSSIGGRDDRGDGGGRLPGHPGRTGFGDSGDGVYAYFDTRRELGTIVEALEPPTRMPDPELVWGAPGSNR